VRLSDSVDLQTTVIIQGKGFTFGIGCGFENANPAWGEFRKTWGATPSCSDYVALDIPYLSVAGPQCTFSTATCTVDAV